MALLKQAHADGKQVLAAFEAAAKDKNPEVRKAAEEFVAELNQRLEEARKKIED